MVVVFIASFMDDVACVSDIEVCTSVQHDLLHTRVHLL